MVAAAAALDSGAHDHPLVRAALRGVSAGAVGMVLYVTVQLGFKSIRRPADAVFAAATLVCISVIHESVLLALVTVAPVATFWFRPRKNDGDRQ
jgi:chromate transporter